MSAFGIFQIWCVETFDEPAVNWLQEGIGLYVSALIVPMLREAGSGPQLPPTGLLLLCNRQCPPQSSLRLTFLTQASTASCPAGDTVQLQKTSRLLFLLFELPRLTNQGQPQAGRGSRGQRRHGKDISVRRFRSPLPSAAAIALRISSMPSWGSPLWASRAPSKETCPVIGTCEPVLDAEGYRFISMSCGPLWITTYGAEERHVAQS